MLAPGAPDGSCRRSTRAAHGRSSQASATRTRTLDQQFDLVVIGSGPAGQRAAVAAAKLGQRVALVDNARDIGGVCLHTGTIPSKTLREAILYLSGYRQRSFYGRDYSLKEQLTFADLTYRVHAVVARELEVVRAQLKRNGVTLVFGQARFDGASSLVVDNGGGRSTPLTSRFVLIACGTRPARSDLIPFDGARVIDSDEILAMRELPREMIVVGGGVIGLEYASMFSALGVRVTIVDAREQLLDFVDRELVDMLVYIMRQQNAVFCLGDSLEQVTFDARGRVVARLASQRVVRGDVLLYSAGRTTNADRLNLGAAGLSTDSRGRIKVNEVFQTQVPHIYAAGDVIGFPALAATSAEQGRLSASHMFGARFAPVRGEHIPYGIYTIPEISMVGAAEHELVRRRLSYDCGLARFGELARAQMMGVEQGLLKVLFHQETGEILGVHAIGDSATELIHIGQAAMALGATIHYFRDAVFNYPTLAEAYKVAGLDGTNRLLASTTPAAVEPEVEPVQAL